MALYMEPLGMVFFKEHWSGLYDHPRLNEANTGF